jgi:PAS domain S-box-containing protein
VGTAVVSLLVAAGGVAGLLLPPLHAWASRRGLGAVADVLCGVLGGLAAWYAWRTRAAIASTKAATREADAHRALAEALVRDESRLRAITNAIPGVLVQYHLPEGGNGRATFLNEQAEQLFGYPLDALRNDVFLAWQQVPREDLDRMLAERTRSAEQLTRWVQEFRVERSGTLRWVRGEAIPERESDGSTRWHGILMDITATKALEQTLRDREEDTRRLHELAQSTALGFDERLRGMLGLLRKRFGSSVAAISRPRQDGMELLFVDASEPGFAEGAFFPEGHTFCHAIFQSEGPVECADVGASAWREHPAYQSTNMESFIGIRISAAGEALASLCLMAKEPRPQGFDRTDREFLRLVSMWVGNEFEREAAAAALRASQQQLEQRVAERTDELVTANLQLRFSEERLRHALAVGRSGLWERDVRTGTVIWDERLRDILGVPDGGDVDVLGWFTERLHPNDRATIERLVADAERGGPDYVHECRYQRLDGRWIWLSMSGGPRLNAAGDVTHLTGTTADITSRKEAEAELQRLTEDLDQRVVTRTHALDESRRRLQDLVGELTRAEERERRRLATELHDTLTQTLTLGRMNVAQASALLVDGAPGGQVSELLTQVQMVLDSSIAYTRTLISELSPRVLYDFGLPLALEWLGEQMRSHGLDVTVSGPDAPPELRDDQSVLLFQAARELLWNVVKHAKARRASIRWSVHDGHVVLVVEDSGRGFQGTTSDGGGFGLLSIRERLALQGGGVDVRSMTDRGSTVTVRLPLQGARDEPRWAASRAAATSSRPIRVMIVEDHLMVREGLCRVLGEHRSLAIVGQVGDGQGAVDLADECEPDVIIMDVNLPTLNGIEATRRIRERSSRAIVIGISSGADDYVVKAMKGAGAFACLVKERAVEDLYRVIDDAVAAREGLARGAGFETAH